MINEINQIKNIEEISIVIDKIDEIDIMNKSGEYLFNEKILLKNILYALLSKQKNKIEKYNHWDLNLSKLFSKRLFTGAEIERILKNFPNVNRKLGTVPKIFLDKAADKTICANKLFDVFAKYSTILNSDIEELEECSGGSFSCLTDFSAELSDIVNKKAVISYVGHGSNGNGFKVSIDNKNFFYKVFFPHNYIQGYGKNYRHGYFIEPAYGLFANRNARKKQFVKFYFGQIATKYDRDAFMLTDFLGSDYSRPNEKLDIDYVTLKESELLRTDNIREGRIVDFGGMITNKDSELNCPKLRKLVRVITNHITYKHDKNKFSFFWKISNSNLNSLKQFISKYDKETYIKALDIIKNQVKISDKIIVKLTNINDIEGEIEDEQILNISDMIADDVVKLKENIAEFLIKCKTESSPTEYFDGYIILDLNDKKQCVIMYDKNNKTTLIRLEKQENKQFRTILELRGNSISQYNKEGPFYTLLT